MKSLYRRYRPVELGGVIGQEQVTKPLINALKLGKVSHAYLLIGPRGCGKTSVARILAHEVNGFDYKVEDNYVDIIEIDGASNRGIDNIRDLRDKAMIAPTTGKYKVYIIDEVHMLTKEAFNALLKILEEPPAHVIFIMATTDAYKVPVTITSRAQCYTFKLADQNTMFDFLKSVIENEKINIDDDALRVIVKRGGGSFRDSLSLLDQIATLSEEKITKPMVISAMGLPEDEKMSNILEAYINHDPGKTIENLNNLFSSGIKAETISSELISLIIEEPKPELINLLSSLPDVKAPYAEARLIVALSQDMPVAVSNNHIETAKSVPIREQTTNTGSINNSSSAKAPDHSDLDSKQTTEFAATQAVSNIQVVNFDWDDYLERIRHLSDAVYTQLNKTKHSFARNTLTIYPMRKIVKSILSRSNNKKILTDVVGQGIEIIIAEADEYPQESTQDQTLNKISDIMGGEVINDAGNSPF